MFKFYNLIFYLGIFTSIFSGVGLKLGFVDQNTAAMYGILGILGTGLGYAGKYYFNRKMQVENVQYYKQMKSIAEKRKAKQKNKAKNK